MKIRSAEFIKSARCPEDFPRSEFPEVAFVGRSNVGKSSLINTLLNRRRLAQTSNTPGRTRLINYFEINNLFYFVDLPGYGYARVPLAIKKEWGPMIERYLKIRENLVLVLMILDARRIPSKGDEMLKQWLECNSIPFRYVMTKADKLSSNEFLQQRRRISDAFNVLQEDFMPFSALTGRGKENVWKVIGAALEGFRNSKGNAGEAVID